MAEQTDDPKSPFAGWQTFGLPAFASALAPWYDKLIDAALIPEYYESSLKIVATVLGPLICFLLWLTCDRLTRRRLIWLAYLSLSLFLLALAGCLGLSFTVDILWYPEQGAQLMLRLVWPAAYLAVFAGFSAAVVSGLLLARRRPAGKPARSAVRSPRRRK